MGTVQLGALRVEVVRGDITREHVDAVVNAANASLLGGGGVDGAIHAAAGPRLLEECREVRRTRFPTGLPVGDAVATGAGELACRWVIHTVGPNLHAGQSDPALLRSCFRRCLEVADELGAVSVAFPAVSSGVYGWPVATTAREALAAVRDQAPRTGVRLIRFVLFSAEALQAFEAGLEELVSGSDPYGGPQERP